MPPWSDLLNQLQAVPPAQQSEFFARKTAEFTASIAEATGRNVLYYASSFLQKPHVPPLFTSINAEDLNGFMAGVHGLDFSKDLLLILHTPGGMATGAQTIVEYLRTKFESIDVVIPTYAMSAGTMIALGCDRIVMGRQSQLGPTDPQLNIGNRYYSAHSLVAQFEEAKVDIVTQPMLAHAWAPVLQSFGPALLKEAKNAIEYGERLVTAWLSKYMFKGIPSADFHATQTAKYFAGTEHGNHGRRIGRDEAREQNLVVVDLEDDQELQEAVLSLYHLSTIGFDQGPALKSIISSTGKIWLKNLNTAAVASGPNNPAAHPSAPPRA